MAHYKKEGGEKKRIVLMVVVAVMLLASPAVAKSPHDGPCGPFNGDVGHTDVRGVGHNAGSIAALSKACAAYLEKH